MSLDPDELEIREAFERRRPATVPPELLARVAAVPGEVQPLRPMPVRLALGVAPWLAVGAAGLALAFGPRFVASLPGPATGALDPGATWTPANPGGGFADEGIFGAPWVPALLFIATAAIVQAAWTRVRRVRDGALIVKPTGPSAGRSAGPATRRGKLKVVGQFGLIVVASMVLTSLGSIDPILYGSTGGPGPEVTEVRDGEGTWFDETVEPPEDRLQGAVPNYVFRVQPGDAFSTLVSIRNTWPVPITVLGLYREGGTTTDMLLAGADAVQNGLGLLRDTTRISAEAGDVVPFQPVALGPGEEVVLVVAWVAGSCADPTADVTFHGSESWAARPFVNVVYDVLGWRRQGWTYGPFDISVPSTPGCLPPFFVEYP